MTSPEKETAKYCRDKELQEGIVGAFFAWVFTGFLGMLFNQGWMFTDLGFYLVGVPYGLALLAVPICMYVQKNRREPPE